MLLLKSWYHLCAGLQKLFLRLLYGRRFQCGAKTHWRRHFSVLIGRDGAVRLGRAVFFNNGCSLAAENCIEIGDDTLFGENVKIYDHNHRFRDAERPIREQGFSVGTVRIGKNCWIGSNCVLLKGACIGDHCVIGAGAVIDFEVPPGTLVKAGRGYEVLPLCAKD